MKEIEPRGGGSGADREPGAGRNGLAGGEKIRKERGPEIEPGPPPGRGDECPRKVGPGTRPGAAAVTREDRGQKNRGVEVPELVESILRQSPEAKGLSKKNGDDLVYLLGAELGVDREAKYLPCMVFRSRQSARRDKQSVPIGWLLVNRYGIENSRPDSVSAEKIKEGIAGLRSDRKLVIDMAAVCCRGGEDQTRNVSQSLCVGGGDFSTVTIVGIQVGKFYSQDGSLDFVESRIHPRNFTDVTLLPTILAE